MEKENQLKQTDLKEKKATLKCFLSAIRVSRPDITGLELDDEYVKVHMAGTTATTRVCIAADSCTAMMFDILRQAII